MANELDQLKAIKADLLDRRAAMAADPATLSGISESLGLPAADGATINSLQNRRLALDSINLELADLTRRIGQLEADQLEPEDLIQMRNRHEFQSRPAWPGRGHASPIYRRRT